ELHSDAGGVGGLAGSRPNDCGMQHERVPQSGRHDLKNEPSSGNERPAEGEAGSRGTEGKQAPLELLLLAKTLHNHPEIHAAPAGCSEVVARGNSGRMLAGGWSSAQESSETTDKSPFAFCRMGGGSVVA